MGSKRPKRSAIRRKVHEKLVREFDSPSWTEYPARGKSTRRLLVALKKIRQEIKKKQQQQAAQSRREDDDRIRLARENERVIRSAVQCVRRLESKFWNCANELARLCASEVDSSSRARRSFWSRLFHGSLVTAERPELYVTLEPLSPEMGQHHTIRLEARPELIQFEATYGLRTEEVLGVQGIRYTHVVCKSTCRISDLSAREGKQWLESQFEKYYRELTDWKKEFPDLWDQRRRR